MKTKDTVTPEDFAKFLRWLDKDPVEAGNKYTYIQKKLIQWFSGRGCGCAEDLADEVINRVIFKVRAFPEGNEEGENERVIRIEDRLPFFYAVANYVFKEHLREKNRPPVLWTPPADDPRILEYRSECLQSCRANLTDDQFNLIDRYVNNGNKSKKDHRKDLADSLGITLDALRIRACRLRSVLRACIKGCVNRAAMSEIY